MKKEKEMEYTYPFINNGKPFKIPPWTNKKNKEVLSRVSSLVDDKKGMPDSEKDEIYRKILVLKGLEDIDSNVTEENLDSMHPDDLLALFLAIYTSGRKGITTGDFRKAKDQKPKKEN